MTAAYDFQDASWDAYWYSLYNMSTNISMSANGVPFPNNDTQRQQLQERQQGMLQHARVDKPPIQNPNLNVLPFTEGDPHFTQEPVFDAGDGRPDAATLTWDMAESSGVVSPASIAWTHLKGVTWAKNFQNHADLLPDRMAPLFRSQVLTTLGQIGIRAALVAGGPQGNGLLTKGDTLELVSGVAPAEGEVVDATPRPAQHAAMLWFLSDLLSLAQGEWYGYVNPEPLIPPPKLQELTDGMAKTTMNLFTPADVVDIGSTRDLGVMLGAFGWYGTHAGSADLRSQAADYANALADEAEANREDDGTVSNGADNQAATQGAVGQGLIWASQIQGVDWRGAAESILVRLLASSLDQPGIFDTGAGSTHRYTARDAGDITGGLNALRVGLDRDVNAEYASFLNQVFNRGRLQRAERPQSRDEEAEYPLPLPPEAGGEFGHAAVYCTAVEYDANADEWETLQPRFSTEQALYLANQEIWLSQWGGKFFQGSGVPGKNDTPVVEPSPPGG